MIPLLRRTFNLIVLLAGAGLAAAAESSPIRIALVTDPHTTRGTHEDQAQYRERLRATIRQVNAADVAAVVVTGDLTQNGKAEEAADFKQEMAAVHAPALWVPGNHDVGAKIIPGKPGGVTSARVRAFEQELGPSFYVRTVAGIRWIGVNSSLFGSGLPEESAMWSLLEKELSHPGPVPTVVFMHYPPFVKSSDEPGGTYWNIEPPARRRLLALLERGGVKLVLTGHLHYQLINHYHGILIVTSAPVSFGLPRGVAPQGWNLVTIPPQGEAAVEFHRVY